MERMNSLIDKSRKYSKYEWFVKQQNVELIWPLLLTLIKSTGLDTWLNIMNHDVCERASFGSALFLLLVCLISAGAHQDLKIIYISQKNSVLRNKDVITLQSLKWDDKSICGCIVPTEALQMSKWVPSSHNSQREYLQTELPVYHTRTAHVFLYGVSP